MSFTQNGLVDYYQVLGVTPKATPLQIQTAFQQRAAQLNPDLLPAETPEHKRAVVNREFLQIQKAYKLLSDSSLRQTYDQRLAGIPIPFRATPNPAVPPAALDEETVKVQPIHPDIIDADIIDAEIIDPAGAGPQTVPVSRTPDPIGSPASIPALPVTPSPNLTQVPNLTGADRVSEGTLLALDPQPDPLPAWVMPAMFSALGAIVAVGGMLLFYRVPPTPSTVANTANPVTAPNVQISSVQGSDPALSSGQNTRPTASQPDPNTLVVPPASNPETGTTEQAAADNPPPEGSLDPDSLDTTVDSTVNSTPANPAPRAQSSLFGDREIQQFVKAFFAVQPLLKDTEQKLKQAKSETDRQSIKDQFNRSAAKIIQANGLTTEQYQLIAQLAREDASIQEAVRQASAQVKPQP